jgi:hypothetical protein
MRAPARTRGLLGVLRGTQGYSQVHRQCLPEGANRYWGQSGATGLEGMDKQNCRFPLCT